MTDVTVAQALAWAQQQVAAQSDSAKLDAQVLLLHLLKKPKSYLYAWSDALLDDTIWHQFQQLVMRRSKGEPIAHITGMREFWSLPFYVNPSTLIPRPDTETLVDYALSLSLPANAKVLDLGTGTGAIALALASERPTWRITAVDYSHDAVALATKNRDQLGLPQVEIVQGSWFTPLPASQFDLIVSNPPYIDPDDPHLSQGDVRFEPLSALVAPEQGLADIRHIVSQGRQFLSSGGHLALEHGYDQAEAVQRIFAEMAYINILTIKDMAGCDRVTVAQWPSF
ncbi:peptide chain release factor N(5)-glutamine methyltransferase [Pseudoalteromonas fenneropenaei]|uniref:Release factor glutamine methyltransferase n=1 Tax=Pseudoalteromonas fenneropenaei TaxID=1737459 RepID=A0ABV7CGR8_9GAMM